MSDTTATPTFTEATLAPARRLTPSTRDDDRAVNEGPPWRWVEIRWQARAVAQGIALAPFAVFGVLMIVTAPAGVAIVTADWAFGTGALALETLVVVVLMAVTVAGLFWSVAYGTAPTRCHSSTSPGTSTGTSPSNSTARSVACS